MSIFIYFAYDRFYGLPEMRAVNISIVDFDDIFTESLLTDGRMSG